MTIKKILFAILFLGCILSCTTRKEEQHLKQQQWEQRKIKKTLADDLLSGKTYLSVYSKIYSGKEHITHNLTATISMRNVSATDTIYIRHASYFDTHGKQIRDYLKYPIFVKPMETVFIVIEEIDGAGGTGGNFLFTWQVKENTPEPLFESVMISTSGQQGLSFSVQGKRVE